MKWIWIWITAGVVMLVYGYGPADNVWLVLGGYACFVLAGSAAMLVAESRNAGR